MTGAERLRQVSTPLAWACLVLWIVGPAGLLFLTFGKPPAETPQCRDRHLPAVNDVQPVRSGAGQLRLSLSEEETGIDARLGRSFDARELEVSLSYDGLLDAAADAQLSTDDVVLDVRSTALTRADGAPLRDEVRAVVVWDPQQRAADLRVCVTRDVGRAGNFGGLSDPGAYSGVLRLDDDRAAPLDVPVTVTLSWPEQGSVLALVWLTISAGWLVTYVAHGDSPADERLRPGSAARLWAWTLRPRTIIRIAVAGTAAAAATKVQYYDSAAWGTGVGDVFALAGGAFTAFVGAATTASLLTGKTPEDKGGAPGTTTPGSRTTGSTTPGTTTTGSPAPGRTPPGGGATATTPVPGTST